MPKAKKKARTKPAKKKAAAKKAPAKKKAKKKVAKKKVARKKAPAKKKKVAKKKVAKKKVPTKKKAVTKKATKKPTKKKAVKKKVKRKPSAAFMKPVTPDAKLSEIVGAKPIPRTQVTKNLWAYIKKNDLQDPVNRRMINADAKLMAVFNGKKKVNMFEMTKLVSKHMK